jgi:hypothetical protein
MPETSLPEISLRITFDEPGFRHGRQRVFSQHCRDFSGTSVYLIWWNDSDPCEAVGMEVWCMGNGWWSSRPPPEVRGGSSDASNGGREIWGLRCASVSKTCIFLWKIAATCVHCICTKKADLLSHTIALHVSRVSVGYIHMGMLVYAPKDNVSHQEYQMEYLSSLSWRKTHESL